MEKTAGKNTLYWRNKTILKIGHLAKAIDVAKWTVWLKNSNDQKRQKKDSTSTLEVLCAKNRCTKYSKKPLERTPYYWRNKTILKIGHLAKAIDVAKWTVWLKNSNDQKRQKKDSTSTLEVLCEKPLEKAPNIREMRPFWKSAILQRL